MAPVDSSELLQKLQALENENKRLLLAKEKLEIKVDSLTIKLTDALRRLYGRSSERFENPDQRVFEFMKLGEEASKELDAEEAERAALEAQAAEEEEVVVRRKKHRGRNPLPKDLPVRVERIELSAEEKICPCGCGLPMVQINEKITEELEYEPSQCYIRRLIRPVLACAKRHEYVVVAPLPPRPIDRGRPGPGLLAHLAVSKYGDHLPLYRLEQIFARSGLELSRKTMCQWLGDVAGLLEPIVEAQAQWILDGGFLQADETPIQVMDPALPGRTRKGYLWVYGIPWAEVVFDFQSSRARAGPTKFLAKFKGHLQTDGYAGYNEIVRLRSIVRLVCWAHARRAFHKAKRYHPKDCLLILGLIQKLYRLEREAKANGLDPAAKVAMRRREAVPILETLKVMIQTAAATVLPESLLGKATQYALGFWTELTRYVEVGELEIDNNSIENSIRAVAIGRKNYLFLGSPEGGGLRAEVFYSLVGTCKRLGINPFEYLRDVIDRVSTHPASRVLELIPRFWHATRQQSAAAAGPIAG
jgi:transposase